MQVLPGMCVYWDDTYDGSDLVTDCWIRKGRVLPFLRIFMTLGLAPRAVHISKNWCSLNYTDFEQLKKPRFWSSDHFYRLFLHKCMKCFYQIAVPERMYKDTYDGSDLVTDCWIQKGRVLPFLRIFMTLGLVPRAVHVSKNWCSLNYTDFEQQLGHL